MTEGQFDVLVVGGGSAGSVLASRLSEDPRRRVALIEAGPDLPIGALPPEISSPYPGRAYVDPRFARPYPGVLTGGAHWNDAARRPQQAYTQGGGIGGGSTINGLGANRGSPADYDEWATLGAKGWEWRNVLPYFRKLERDIDFAGPLHGSDGPLPIRNAPREWRSRFVDAAVEALARRGVAEHPDQNGEWRDGVFAQRVNLDDRLQRVPTAKAWLTAEVRDRPNLVMMTGVSVGRIVLADGRVTGVTIALGAVDRFVAARHVVVCAGAFGSPTLLMRSGIGPGPHLASRGVPVLRHLPGVGANLMDHPYAGISMHLPRTSRMPAEHAHHIPAIWRFSSGLQGCPAGDMHMGFIGRVAWHAMGQRIGALAFWVNKSFSRGTVELAPMPADPPQIDLRLLSDQRDRQRLKAAFRTAAAVAAEMAATGVVGPPHPARLSDRSRRFGAPTPGNAALMRLAALAVDCAGPFAAALSRRMAYDGPPLATLLADDAALDDYLDASVTGVWHPSGTCRMGADADPMAVTDPKGAVRGVEGLTVCDASIFPTIPCANLNVPVIMAAERIADLLRRGALR